MRPFRSSVLVFLVSLAACGSSGSSHKSPDASTQKDAAIDSPAGGGLTGLGKKCTSPTDCPATAPNCIGINGGPMVQYCTPACVTNGTAKGAANNQLTMITPAPSDAACAAQYTATVGTPKCALISKFTPMDNPIVANKAYTGVEMECAILCGANNTCPTGTVANSGVGACLCFPM